MSGLPRRNRLRWLLTEGKAAFGVFCSTPAPEAVELIGCAGYDFAILDTEHTLIAADTLGNMLRAADAVNLPALVRVSDASRAPILRALDAGAAGVLIPNVETPEEVGAAVRASRYHPHGQRGLNAGRSTGFGRQDLAAGLSEANDDVVVALLIESRRGVETIETILAVPGVDLVVEGAADLSQSMGVPWQTRHCEVRSAVRETERASRRHGVPFCAIPRADEDFAAWWRDGVRTFVLGDERSIAFQALKTRLVRFKERQP